ncbi:KamA family radical SAM protein [Wolbachia endosymbiont (group A) of Myopa testacea]|uniref:KamA family radical SAM protein n=1 Tax=Wolbachia endosymbiont (group A) of Myopa testacea TaxID=3066148 RepID=UPI003340937E
MSTSVIGLSSKLLNQDVSQLKDVANKYPVLMTPFITKRISNGTYSKNAALQYLPNVQELTDNLGSKYDPCNERSFKQTNNLIRKYSNRVALILTHRCLSYCRFCFRKDFVGYDNQSIKLQDIEDSINYIENHSECRDVLLSGGDPLAISNKSLFPVLERLCLIPHVKSLRIHTRALSLAPHRINNDLIQFLKNNRKFWFYCHMNHPDDLNYPDIIDALHKIQDTGTPVLNQCVILKKVNDSPEIVNNLMMDLYNNRIVPYHIYVFDRVKGADHFSVGIDILLKIFESLSELPGPAQPVFVFVDQNNTKRKFVYDDNRSCEILRSLLSSKILSCQF